MVFESWRVAGDQSLDRQRLGTGGRHSKGRHTGGWDDHRGKQDAGAQGSSRRGVGDEAGEARWKQSTGKLGCQALEESMQSVDNGEAQEALQGENSMIQAVLWWQ